MFCVKCGLEKPIFRDGVCIQCYLEEHTFSSAPEIMDIEMCSHCGLFRWKLNWIEEEFSDRLLREVKHTFDVSDELGDVRFVFDEIVWQDNNAVCKISVCGMVGGVEVCETHEILVRVKRLACDICSKQFGGYFEAIIQLRASERKLEGDELEVVSYFLEECVVQMQKGGALGLFIMDRFEERGGVDYYISDKSDAYIIAKKVLEHFGGELKQTASNAGMKDGKAVVRMTYLVRLPSYRVHDVLMMQQRPLFIVQMSASKVSVIDLVSWEKKTIEAKYASDAKVFPHEEYVEEMIVVSQSESEMQVMHPSSYRVFDIKKPSGLIDTENGMVKVVHIVDDFYLIPPLI